MTYKERLEKYVKENFIGKDLTCNGKCSKCGECCGSILPIDQDDANRIQEYVVKNKIFPQRQALIMRNKLQCPYYTGNKCAIYEARPKICRYFQCNKRRATLEEIKAMAKAMPVDMWAYAEALEKEMIKHGLNKETRKTVK